MVVIVMIVVIVEGSNERTIIRRDDKKSDMCLPAFMILIRNNEMIEWFAKYFL
jgi:hypothetical protein